MRLVRRAKLVPARRSDSQKTRYGFNIHNTCDLAISLLATVPDLKDHCVEYWAGHDIDPLHYKDLTLHPQFLEDQYRLAIPYLNIISGKREPELTEETIIERVLASPRFRDVVRELIDRAPKYRGGDEGT